MTAHTAVDAVNRAASTSQQKCHRFLSGGNIRIRTRDLAKESPGRKQRSGLSKQAVELANAALKQSVLQCSSMKATPPVLVPAGGQLSLMPGTLYPVH